MLERVSLSQPRFATPGLQLDSRGIALGPRGVLLFGGVDRLVRFLRALTQEGSLDDLGHVALGEVRGKVGVRQMVFTVQTPSSYLADRLARVARLFGGQLYVGERRHFVQYRDPGAPHGYDIPRVQEEDVDLVLYGDAATLPLSLVRTTELGQFVVRLGLIEKHLHDEDYDASELWFVVRGQPSERLLSHLFRRGVKMEAVLLPRPEGALFAERFGDLIVRVERPSVSLARLLTKTPGVVAYRPILPNVLVELGWDHPLQLDSVQRFLPTDKLIFFGGRSGRVELVDGGLRFVAGELLVEARGERGAAVGQVATAPLERLQVPLELAPGPSAARPRAALVPREREALLRRLVYALPQPLLSRLRAAVLDVGVLIVGDEGIGLCPGDLYYEIAPSVLAPMGVTITPRVEPRVLQDVLVGGRPELVVLRVGAPAFALADEKLVPLGRALLRPAELTHATAWQPEVPPEGEPGTLVNDPPPWWGFVRGA